MAITVGDAVRLKSGGPVMTVRCIYQTEAGEAALCEHASDDSLDVTVSALFVRTLERVVSRWN